MRNFEAESTEDHTIPLVTEESAEPLKAGLTGKGAGRSAYRMERGPLRADSQQAVVPEEQV